jgi:hypothetical protein
MIPSLPGAGCVAEYWLNVHNNSDGDRWERGLPNKRSIQGDKNGPKAALERFYGLCNLNCGKRCSVRTAVRRHPWRDDRVIQYVLAPHMATPRLSIHSHQIANQSKERDVRDLYKAADAILRDTLLVPFCCVANIFNMVKFKDCSDFSQWIKQTACEIVSLCCSEGERATALINS